METWRSRNPLAFDERYEFFFGTRGYHSKREPTERGYLSLVSGRMRRLHEDALGEEGQPSRISPLETGLRLRNRRRDEWTGKGGHGRLVPARLRVPPRGGLRRPRERPKTSTSAASPSIANGGLPVAFRSTGDRYRISESSAYSPEPCYVTRLCDLRAGEEVPGRIPGKANRVINSGLRALIIRTGNVWNRSRSRLSRQGRVRGHLRGIEGAGFLRKDCSGERGHPRERNRKERKTPESLAGLEPSTRGNNVFGTGQCWTSAI